MPRRDQWFVCHGDSSLLISVDDQAQQRKHPCKKVKASARREVEPEEVAETYPMDPARRASHHPEPTKPEAMRGSTRVSSGRTRKSSGTSSEVQPPGSSSSVNAVTTSATTASTTTTTQARGGQMKKKDDLLLPPPSLPVESHNSSLDPEEASPSPSQLRWPDTTVQAPSMSTVTPGRPPKAQQDIHPQSHAMEDFGVDKLYMRDMIAGDNCKSDKSRHGDHESLWWLMV